MENVFDDVIRLTRRRSLAPCKTSAVADVSVDMMDRECVNEERMNRMDRVLKQQEIRAGSETPAASESAPQLQVPLIAFSRLISAWGGN
jgi:hypothetical protein